MTPEQKAKLLLAIGRAEGAGLCQYMWPGGRPRCVIGQLAVLEGIDPATIRAWESRPVGVVLWRLDAGSAPLRAYAAHLLIQLQRIWDRSDTFYAGADDAALRDGMRALVEAAS